jgi:triacylglycerol lipase
MAETAVRVNPSLAELAWKVPFGIRDSLKAAYDDAYSKMPSFPELLHNQNPTSYNPDYLPALLVHGFASSPECFFKIKADLEEKGFRVYTVSLPYGGSIDSYLMRTVNEKVQEILQDTQYSSLHLIGHSMGGLVCSHVAQLKENADKIASLTTISAPHQGSELAFLLSPFFKKVKQMLPGSPYYEDWIEKMHALSTKIPVYTIEGTEDHVVSPQSAAIPQDPSKSNKSYLIKGVGHCTILVNKEVSRILVENLSAIEAPLDFHFLEKLALQ